jgi:hypothetical protein
VVEFFQVNVSIPQITEYVAVWLVSATFFGFVLRMRKRTFSVRLAFVMICGFLPFLRWNGLALAGYVFGLYGSISIASVLLLALKAAQILTGETYFSKDERGITYCLLAVGGLILYPTSLGLIVFNAYRSSFASPLFVLLLFALAIGFTMLRLRLPALLIGVCVAAFQLRLLESLNLWDYLLDPMLFFFSAALAIRYVAKRSVHLFRRPVNI